MPAYAVCTAKVCNASCGVRPASAAARQIAARVRRGVEALPGHGWLDGPAKVRNVREDELEFLEQARG